MARPTKGHRWFAGVYDRMMASAERSFMRRVREEIAGGAHGRVLELGAGTGANFAYYAEGAEEIAATEPDPFMMERATLRTQGARRPITLHQAPAEQIPFDDDSFDTVVSTLVMCTVRDPGAALAEVRRVLKPSGQLRMYEHVRYDHAFGAFWQDAACPVWRWLGAGCHPNRDIAAHVRGADFDFLRLEHSKPLPLLPPFCLTRPHMLAIAKPT
jgi:ubiquinone/menaquinone biosynthesis C-methylase UbiE